MRIVSIDRLSTFGSDDPQGEGTNAARSPLRRASPGLPAYGLGLTWLALTGKQTAFSPPSWMISSWVWSRWRRVGGGSPR